MSKYRSNTAKQPKASVARAGAADKPTEADVKEEKKFFQIAIIVTLAIIGIIWYLLS